MDFGSPNWYLHENYLISVRLVLVGGNVMQQRDFYEYSVDDSIVDPDLDELPDIGGDAGEEEEEPLLVPMQQPLMVHQMQQYVMVPMQVDDLEDNDGYGIIQPDGGLFSGDDDDDDCNMDDEYANDADDEYEEEYDDCESMCSYADYGYFSGDEWEPFGETPAAEADVDYEDYEGGDDIVIVWENPAAELSDDSGTWEDIQLGW